MADPKRLDVLWNEAVTAYPELGRKWGAAGHPVDSKGNALAEPLQEYQALLRAKHATATTTPDALTTSQESRDRVVSRVPRTLVPPAPPAPQVPQVPGTTPSGLAVSEPDYWQKFLSRGGDVVGGIASIAKTLNLPSIPAGRFPERDYTPEDFADFIDSAKSLSSRIIRSPVTSRFVGWSPPAMATATRPDTGPYAGSPQFAHIQERLKKAGEAMEALPKATSEEVERAGYIDVIPATRFTSSPPLLRLDKESVERAKDWWKQGLSAFGGFLEPEAKALRASTELTTPAAGAFLAHSVLSEPEVLERYEYKLSQGHDKVSAMSSAFLDSLEAGDIPWWKSMLAQAITDPFELLPFGWGFGAGKKLISGIRAGTTEVLPKGLPVVAKGLPAPKAPPVTPEVAPVVEMQKALPMTDALPDVSARDLAQRQATEAADVAQEAGRREGLIARERDVLGRMWTGKTPQKTTKESAMSGAPSIPVATPVITDDFGRIWVGAIPKGGKNAIERMTPEKRAEYGRWASLGDEITGSKKPLVDRPPHPVETVITDDMRNVWRAEEAAGRNNPLSTLVEYSQRGLDNIPTFKPARSRYLNTLSRQIFGNANKENVTKIEDYVYWINNPEDSVFKWEQKGFFDNPVEQVRLAMRDPKVSFGLFDEFYMIDPKTGIPVLRANKPPRHSGRGTPNVVEASATTQQGHKGYPSIADPVTPDDTALLDNNLISRWIHDANWGVLGLKIIDEARKSINSMATVDELASGYFRRAAAPFKAATRRFGAIARLNETFLSDFIEEGTEELQRLGWLDKNRRATLEAIGTVEAPGPLRILFRALHGKTDINPDSGLTWHQELSKLGVDAERQYNNLRKITDWEEVYRIQGDMIKTSREDYFYRGWTYADGEWEGIKKNIGNRRAARPGTPASVMMSRNKLSFIDMEKLGFRPTFYNPYEMAATSSNMGMQYRLQLEFLRILKSDELGLAEAVKKGGDTYNDKVQEGWREVLGAGPAFKGERFYGRPHKFNHVGYDKAGGIDANGEIVKVSFDVNATFSLEHVWLFPKEIADEIERLFAPASAFEKFMKQQRRLGYVRLGVDVKIDDLIFIPKRAKLFMSLFQQVDFFSRAGIGGTSAALFRLGNGMRMMSKGDLHEGFREMYASVFHVKMIGKSWQDMAHANVSPSRRKTLKKMRLDDTPWHLPDELKGNKKLIDQWKIDNPELAQYSWINAFANGLSVGDVTIFGTADDAVKLLDDILKQQDMVRAGISKSANFVRQLESAFRAGLFEGVYPAAIMHDLRYNIIPILKMIHPDLNPDQLMALAVKQANKKWSTIPIEQSQFRGLGRSILTRTMFSLNEFESMARQITGAVKGPDKLFWATHWAAAFVFFAAVGNLIHFMTTSLVKRQEDGKWTIDPNRGEGLPWNRYLPYKTGGYYTLGYKFRDNFLSPDIPVPTRSGDLALLDLLNQFDFIFRMTDGERGIPVPQFFSQRAGTMPRAIVNQWHGTDWMGRDITEYGLGQRMLQFLYDTVAPIGAGQLAIAVARNALKNKELPHLQNKMINLIGAGANIERITPSVESRLGQDGHGILGPVDMGILLQATGLNLKSVSSEDLKDQMVRNTFGKGDHPDHEGLVLRSWKELRAHKDSTILVSIPFSETSNARQVKELEERKAEGAEFWYDDFGKMMYDIGLLGKERRKKESDLADVLYPRAFNELNEDQKAWDPEEWKRRLGTIRRDYRIKRDQTMAIYGTDPFVLAMMNKQGEEPSRSENALEWAIWQWIDVMNKYRDPITGDVDYNKKHEGKTYDEAWGDATIGWDDADSEEVTAVGTLLDRFHMWLDQGDHDSRVDEYYDALTKLDKHGYWQDGPIKDYKIGQYINDEFEKSLRELASRQNRTFEEGLEIWDYYLSASGTEKARLLDSTTEWHVRYIIKNMNVVRKNHRYKVVMENPELDKILIKWMHNVPYLRENGKYYYQLYGKMPSSYRSSPYR